MPAKEVILARGHENILATHKTTFAITKDINLTCRGNCIIAVGANKSVQDLSEEFKRGLRAKQARLTIKIDVQDVIETIEALGDQYLTMNDATDIVIRKSNYIDDRTLAIQATKSAHDLSRKLVDALKNRHQKVSITLTLNY